MHYYVDGYNLLFRLLGSGDTLQANREAIITDLKKKIQLLQINVTLVFDAPFIYGDSTRTHVHPLDIVFSAQGETADEYILKELKEVKKPKEVTVITSDKRLAWQARRKGVLTESSEEFITWLNKRYKNKIRKSQLKTKDLPQIRIGPTVQPVKNVNGSLKPQRKADPTSKECFDYYYQTFLKEYKEEPLPPMPKEVTSKESIPTPLEYTTTTTRKRKPKHSSSPTLSDNERWLQAFEKKLKEDE